ncbi:MAG: rhamnulokinase [Ruminococcaceae bacterium]|nr:rhamnulokinase [Oscillospiraceae bacterium]
MAKKVLAFDFGASSGRAMLGEFDGKMINMTEIHRFSNDPVIVNGTMYWDALRLFHEVKQGIIKALQETKIDAIGIDTWGVDFGLLDKNGELLSTPVNYRDERTVGMPEEVSEIISAHDLYSRTGTQTMRINTIYQLYYLFKYRPELMKLCDKILFMPDLFAYFLTGVKRAEETIASTSNFLDPYKKTWATDILEKIGIESRILPELIKPGEVYGMLSDELCTEFSCDKIPVIAVCTHDTASAVTAAPAKDDFVYISCGTWSLFGTELKEPLINEQSEAIQYTNEGGHTSTTRFLKNIMGLWLIQESRRQWIKEGSPVTYADLEREALAAEPFKCFIDCDAPEFAIAGNIPKRVQKFCEVTGQYVPQTRGEIMRCIYQSLAMKYKLNFSMLRDISGKDFAQINMLGGGIKDTLLCRMTASSTGARVCAGPIEATVMGNIAVQLMALGEIKDVPEAREIIKNSVDFNTYEPENADEWDKYYEEYSKYLGKSGENA